MVQVKLSVRCVCIIFRPHRMHGMQRCVTEVSRGLYVCMTSVAIGCISAIHAMLANNTNSLDCLVIWFEKVEFALKTKPTLRII